MNRSYNKVILAIDFDGTLALGNKSHITLAEPNYALINKLKNIKKNLNCYIKIITARGGKNNLSQEEKKSRYLPLILDFCQKYEVPYDEISFSKEYADLYIDDMTIDEKEDFFGTKRPFTNNSIIFTKNKVIKKCVTALFEKEWYLEARKIINTPEVLFINDETIILSKIKFTENGDTNDIIKIINLFKKNKIKNYPFHTYKQNITIHEMSSQRTKYIIDNLPEHEGTFFHGDLCTEHILRCNGDIYLIDPNYKNIFGSYLTDAGKAFFSLIAYNKNYKEAKRIVDEFGEDVIRFAVSEGLRVVKYKENYISIVNNIADMV